MERLGDAFSAVYGRLARRIGGGSGGVPAGVAVAGFAILCAVSLGASPSLGWVSKVFSTEASASGEPTPESGWQPNFQRADTALFSGQATYSTSFDVPPGRSGMQPALGLAYDSGAMNGLGDEKVDAGESGYGWNVTGIPSIVRNEVSLNKPDEPCHANDWFDWDPNQNRWRGPDCGKIELNGRDHGNDFSLALNGKSYALRKVGAEDDDPNNDFGRYYAPEDPSLLVILHNDKGGDGSNTNITGSWWSVRTADGRHYELGKTVDAEQLLGAFEQADHGHNLGFYTGRGDYDTDNWECANTCWENYDWKTGDFPMTAAYRWYANQASDQDGNIMRFTYTQYWGGEEGNPSWSDSGACRQNLYQGHRACREVAVYPTGIYYNNATPNSASNWKNSVKFSYSNFPGHWDKRYDQWAREGCNDGCEFAGKMFRTTQLLDRVEVYDGNWNTSGSLLWKYTLGLDEVTGNEDGRILTSLEKTNASGNRDAWPVTSFDYDFRNYPGVPIKYPRLSRVDNGLGATHTFGYGGSISDHAPGDDGHSRYSYYVINEQAWDGVRRKYDDGDQPLTRVVHGYDTTDSCTNNSEPPGYQKHCNSPGEDTYTLVGFGKVLNNTYDVGADGSETLKSSATSAFNIDFHDDEDSAANFLLGKDLRQRQWRTDDPTWSQQGNPNPTWKVSDTTSTWSTADSWDKCPADGLGDDGFFVCLHETDTTNYAGQSNAGPVHVQKAFWYEPAKQNFCGDPCTNPPTPRQWGKATRTDTFDFPDNPDQTFDCFRNGAPDPGWPCRALKSEQTGYRANDSENTWLQVPYSKIVFQPTSKSAGNWFDWGGPNRSHALYLYDNEMDPDNQTVTKGHLTATRTLDFTTDLDPNPDVHSLRTIDTKTAYDPTYTGNPTEQTTYAGYGFVTYTDSLVGWTKWSSLGDRSQAHTTTTTYKTGGNQAPGLLPASVENAKGQRTTYAYDDPSFGWLKTAETDQANNRSKTMRYDEYGRPTEVTKPNPGGNGPVATRYQYRVNPSGEDGVAFERGTLGFPSGDDSEKSESWQYYDGLGRLIQTQRVGVGVGRPRTAKRAVNLISLDSLSRKVCESAPLERTGGADFDTAACEDQQSQGIATTEYDPAGRVARVLSPDRNPTTYTYSSPGSWSSMVRPGDQSLVQTKVSKQMDADPSHTRDALTTVDALGRQSWAGSRATYAPDSRLRVTTQEVDALGRTLEQGRGNYVEGSNYHTAGELKTTTTYDGLNHVRAVTDPDRGTTTSTYYPSGKAKSATDANSETVCAYFDELDRLKAKSSTSASCPQDPPTSGDDHLATYTYDQAPGGVGQASKVAWGPKPQDNYELFTYDSLGRPYYDRRVIDRRSYETGTVAYDALDRPTLVRSPAQTRYTAFNRQVSTCAEETCDPTNFRFNAANWDVQSGVDTDHTLDGQSVVKIAEDEPWKSPPRLRRTPYSIRAGDWVVFRFRLSDTSQEGRFGLEPANGGFLGLIFHGGKIYPDYNIGAGDVGVSGAAIDQKASVWYWAGMRIAEDGTPTWVVQREDRPAELLSYAEAKQEVKDYFDDRPLRFFAHVGHNGTTSSPVYLSSYEERRTGDLVTTTYDREGADTVKTGTDAHPAQNALLNGVGFNIQGQATSTMRGSGAETAEEYKGASGNFLLSRINHRNSSGASLSNSSPMYDLAGQLTGVTDSALGETQSYGYNGLGQLTQASVDAADPQYEYDHRFSYDCPPGTGCSRLLGVPHLRDQVSGDHAGDFFYEYDGSHPSLPKAIEPDEQSGGDFRQSFTHDQAGRVKRVEDHDRRGVDYDYTYDAEGKLIRIDASGAVGTVFLGYDAAGASTKIRYAEKSSSWWPFLSDSFDSLDELRWQRDPVHTESAWIADDGSGNKVLRHQGFATGGKAAWTSFQLRPLSLAKTGEARIRFRLENLSGGDVSLGLDNPEGTRYLRLATGSCARYFCLQAAYNNGGGEQRPKTLILHLAAGVWYEARLTIDDSGLTVGVKPPDGQEQTYTLPSLGDPEGTSYRLRSRVFGKQAISLDDYKQYGQRLIYRPFPGFEDVIYNPGAADEQHVHRSNYLMNGSLFAQSKASAAPGQNGEGPSTLQYTHADVFGSSILATDAAGQMVPGSLALYDQLGGRRGPAPSDGIGEFAFKGQRQLPGPFAGLLSGAGVYDPETGVGSSGGTFAGN